MADSIEVHRLRRVMERAEEVKETSTLAHDLAWILHAYDTMIDSLIQIRGRATKYEIEELADCCLDRVDYVGPTY